LKNHSHAQIASIRRRVQAQNFTRLALDRDLERTAADFAIRREPLTADARINHDRARLAAERTGNRFTNFHERNLTVLGQSAMVQTGESVLDREKMKV
jgi:hypothetical protein